MKFPKKPGFKFPVSDENGLMQGRASGTGLKDGRVVIPRMDDMPRDCDTSEWANRAWMFTADNRQADDESLVNIPTPDHQNAPAPAPAPATPSEGRFVVSRTDESETGLPDTTPALRGQVPDLRGDAKVLSGTNSDDVLVGTKLNDIILGKNGSDTLLGKGGTDVLKGGKGNDDLNGGAGRDLLIGDKGNDTLSGGAGRDVLLGKDGTDILKGGAGKDKLAGGKGADELTGGGGADQFVFRKTTDSGTNSATRDVITDFSQAQGDVIQLAGIDAEPGPGNQAFLFVGTEAFSGTTGELRYEQSGGKTMVQGDVDGDQVTDFEIELSGLYTLVAGDFVL